MNKKATSKKEVQQSGVFCTIDKNGKLTDKGIVDELLINEKEITADLVKNGVIRDPYLKVTRINKHNK